MPVVNTGGLLVQAIKRKQERDAAKAKQEALQDTKQDDAVQTAIREIQQREATRRARQEEAMQMAIQKAGVRDSVPLGYYTINQEVTVTNHPPKKGCTTAGSGDIYPVAVLVMVAVLVTRVFRMPKI